MEEALHGPHEWNKIVLKFAVTYPKQTMFVREARFELSFLTHALLIQSENWRNIRTPRTITRQNMQDRLPHSAAMGQSLTITLERTQGIGTTIKSFSGSFVYSCQNPLAVLDTETPAQRLR
jgi:hypothetical protein